MSPLRILPVNGFGKMCRKYFVFLLAFCGEVSEILMACQSLALGALALSVNMLIMCLKVLGALRVDVY